jgi:hypothetical protein
MSQHEKLSYCLHRKSLVLIPVLTNVDMLFARKSETSPPKSPAHAILRETCRVNRVKCEPSVDSRNEFSHS